MGFDLYFAGGKNEVADNYLLEHGGNRLQSQLLDRTNIKNWCIKKSNDNKLFVDSGAYTAYTKGVILDVDSYIDYLNSITDNLTIFAQLDTIPGRFNQPKTAEDRAKAPELSWENYIYMRSKLKEPKKLLPIFHQGENYKWLRNMLEWTDENGEHIPYIGISPAIDVPGMDEFLTRSFDIIAHSSNPNVKTHAFGMTQLKMLEIYPYTSADSTSWMLSAAMGSIYTPWGNVYVSERGKQESSYIGNQPKSAQTRLLAYIDSMGYTFEDVATQYTSRYLINIQYLLDWAKNYQFKGKVVDKKRLF